MNGISLQIWSGLQPISEGVFEYFTFRDSQSFRKSNPIADLSHRRVTSAPGCVADFAAAASLVLDSMQDGYIAN
jgi:hypothetical protein